MKITKVYAREILDSRGKPTLEADITLANGTVGRMMVPSGASTGTFEALELRDKDPARFSGNGVRNAVANVNEKIAPALIGQDASQQASIDQFLIDLDGTENKSNLGANAILGVSVACAKAAAAAEKEPLFRYLGSQKANLLPLPMVNMISGGLHANRSLDLQDFLIMPVGADSIHSAIEMISAVRSTLRTVLEEKSYGPLGMADEGGFGPQLQSHEEAFELLLTAIERSKLKPGDDIAFAIDVAATHFFCEDSYHLQSEQRTLSREEMIDLLQSWTEHYPLISIEDGLAEDDWPGWQQLSDRLNETTQIIGDDLFVTNPSRFQKGIDMGIGNSILVKMNQIGTLTETLKVLEMAREAGYAPVVSARSGETEDATIADLAVGTSAGQIKIGSLATSERNSKYNQLLRIEDYLGDDAVFATPFKQKGK